jgi:hypothetical protein
VTELQLAGIKSDLSPYLRRWNTLTSPEIRAVVADVRAFASLAIRIGIEKSLAQLPNFIEGMTDWLFLEVADFIVEHHLRLVHEADREVLRKSLVEAYIHAAGPRQVFKRPAQTAFERALRRSDSRAFAALFLSLHVFNVVSLAAQDEIRMRAPDVESFESYMNGVETICREMVKGAFEAERLQVDERWPAAMTQNLEVQFLRLMPIKSVAVSVRD